MSMPGVDGRARRALRGSDSIQQLGPREVRGPIDGRWHGRVARRALEPTPRPFNKIPRARLTGSASFKKGQETLLTGRGAPQRLVDRRGGMMRVVVRPRVDGREVHEYR